MLDDGEVRFTIAEVKPLVPFARHQEVRSALTAQKPLENFGITWVQSEGYATHHQEIKWTWDRWNKVLLDVSRGESVEMALRRGAVWW